MKELNTVEVEQISGGFFLTDGMILAGMHSVAGAAIGTVLFPVVGTFVLGSIGTGVGLAVGGAYDLGVL